MNDTISLLNAALSSRYRIERELGEGGMATVYLAEDVKHHRTVALKVLRPELAAMVGAERFLAEIETTANLNHPHILPLFDSGGADSFLFYAMPYVEGESLRERLDRDKQLPVDEAVKIASKVAGALEHAHGQGVIHRDVKPANILLHGGEPVVADFGIALAVGAVGAGRLTETGMSLGTPYYMSPEQATGDQQVGPAADIYALGCVLHEMLVGEPPYTGSTPQAVLGKIIRGEVEPPSEQRRTVPPHVDGAVLKAIETLPADRFARPSELGRALVNPAFRYGGERGLSEAAPSQMRTWMAGAAVVVVLAAATAAWSLLRPEPPQPVARFPSPFLQGQAPTGSMRFLNDGSALIYKGPADSPLGSRLWIRRWESLEATPIPKTEDADREAFALSPDESEIAFHAGAGWGVDGALRIVALEGGGSRTILEGGVAAVWDWSNDGYVYFTTPPPYRIARIPENGRGQDAIEVLTEPRQEEGQSAHIHLDLLPGDELALFETSGEIWALDLESRDRHVVARGIVPSYASTGYLLFGTPDGALLAAPFDPEGAQVLGSPTMVEDDLASFGTRGVRYALSGNGSLIYLEGGTGGRALGEPLWVSRSGQATPVDAGWRFEFPRDITFGARISPDGRKIAFSTRVEGNDDIWLKELPGGPLQRLTFDPDHQTHPTWGPNGRDVTYVSGGVLSGEAWRAQADGLGSPELVLDDERSVLEPQWSPDGAWLVFRAGSMLEDEGVVDIRAFRPGRDTASTPLIASPSFAEYDPSLSRDGRWLAYTSDETGQPEVYVRPFPNVDSGRWRVSVDGGQEPVWAHSGDELFYRDAQQRLVAAEVEATDGAFRVLERTVLFDASGYRFAAGADMYDVASDDDRFLMMRGVDATSGGETSTRHILVQNWLQEVVERVEAP